MAIPWNQVKTSVKDGLMVPEPAVFPPPAAAPMAPRPETNIAAPAILAATYDTAGMLTVLPLLTCEVIQATSAPVSRALSSMVAWAAMSGTENAIDGIKEAYEAGIDWVPVAAKEPDGTV